MVNYVNYQGILRKRSGSQKGVEATNFTLLIYNSYLVLVSLLCFENRSTMHGAFGSWEVGLFFAVGASLPPYLSRFRLNHSRQRLSICGRYNTLQHR